MLTDDARFLQEVGSTSNNRKYEISKISIRTSAFKLTLKNKKIQNLRSLKLKRPTAIPGDGQLST